MYNNEHFDHLFYRMKQNIPTSSKLFTLIACIKLYPLFLLVHTGGYTSPPSNLSTIHTYFSYFSITYYIQNSFGSGNILLISSLIFAINFLLILALLYYFSFANKVKKIDENYTNSSILGTPFFLFSNIAFFKYIILFQFFIEVNFIPLVCINSVMDYDKIFLNKIYEKTIIEDIEGLCNGINFILLMVFSGLNIVIDLGFYMLITSRFFDFNILSDYKWNFYPSLIFSFEFLESCTQVFFIMFLNWNNKIFKLSFDIYLLCICILHSYQIVNNNRFYTSNTRIYVLIADFIRRISYIAGVFIAIFQFAFDTVPNDINIIGQILMEVIIVFIIMKYNEQNGPTLIKNLLVSNLSHLNEKNIYSTMIFLISEFQLFNDIFLKFTDENLDLFLENYVDHLKICEDTHCPCKNYVKKITGASNTIKSGYTTVINFTHMKKDQQEEYILNKFFNVLAANINNTLKYTNNVNLNSISDTQKRQKWIYQLRLKLITAVKKLISYKLEKLTKEIDSVILSNRFSKETKDFIRINFYSISILCNKSYYKTQFLYYEFLSDYFKQTDRSYHLNMIYYFYLKKFSIKEYNEHLSTMKQNRREHSGSGLHLDYRTVMTLCVKYYEIEERLINTVISYQNFIYYFGIEKIIFDKLLVYVRQFKANYKNMTTYISHYFKNDKINNLFICTKIILFFKILHFGIPETLHNKLIIQLHDTDENNKVHSYVDNNYYMILNYIKGEFVIKFISHELLIVLEYSEEELRDKDFHLLLPEKIRKLHKNALINEIKSRAMSSNGKEIFFVSKKQTCVLFDIHYKFLLNLRGEITLLTMVNLKKNTKDFRVCFACIDDHGEVLALNKEFEEYLVLSMKVLDYVKIDTEKLILQTMGPRMRIFFKDPENSEFQEQFDYDLYLSSLFDEEFEILKEKNEREYRRKLLRWEALKEMNRKGRCYTKYIELNVRQRTLGKEIIYFLKYSVKLTLSMRSIEPHNTTLSLIHAVKTSKREMAKLSFFRGDDFNDTKEEKTIDEEKIEEHDDLFESQSQISSAVSQLRDRNSVRLFKQRKNNFKFLPKSRNILLLMISIGIVSFISIIYNIITLLMKKSMYTQTQDLMVLILNSIYFKRSIFTLSSAMLSLVLIEEGNMNMNITSTYPIDYINNMIDLIDKEAALMNNATYTIYSLTSIYYSKEIDEVLNVISEMKYVFNNGLMYQKNYIRVIEEITSLKMNIIELKDMIPLPSISPLVNYMKEYYILDKIALIQNDIITNGKDIELPDHFLYIYFIIHNLYEIINPYSNNFIQILNKEFNSKSYLSTIIITVLKVIELLLIVLIIGIEWAFIKFGYEKAKKKMVRLRHKVEQNNIEQTLKKVNEFMHFSNNFNINSLYFIADLDLKKVEDSSKTEYQQSGGSKSTNALSSSQNVITPRKKNLTAQLNGNGVNGGGGSNAIMNNQRDYDSLTDYHIEVKTPNGLLGDDKPQSLEPPDGKKNLMKVMKKLDQIKHIKKPKEYEKKESEKSKQSLDSSGLCNSDINWNNSNNGHHNGIGSNRNSNGNTSDLKTITSMNSSNKESIKTASEDEHDIHDNNEECDNGINDKKPMIDINSNYNNIPIKSALKSNDDNNNTTHFLTVDKLKKISSTKICKVDPYSNHYNIDEDSKLNILKANSSITNASISNNIHNNNNEEGLGLIPSKKNLRTPKVQFHKDKLVRYYDPVNNVNEILDKAKHSKLDKKDSQKDQNLINRIGSNTSNNTNNNNNNDSSNNNNSMSPNVLEVISSNQRSNPINGLGNKDKKLLAVIQANSLDCKPKDMRQNGLGNNNNDLLSSSLKNTHSHINEANMKDNKENISASNINRFQLIEQGRVVTVKKKKEKLSQAIKKDIIEDKIDNVVHNNDIAKIILHLTLSIFIILYIINITLNYVYNNQINSSLIYTSLLLNETILISSTQLKYRIDLILSESPQDFLLSSLLNQSLINTALITTFEVTKQPNILPTVYNLHQSLLSNESCGTISQAYTTLFSSNSDYEREVNECLLIGDLMNINGIGKAMNYYISTLSILIDDWINYVKLEEFKEINAEVIIRKLNDVSLIKLVIENDYTFRKYAIVMINYIQNDIKKIFDWVMVSESIFGYVSIGLNVLFLVSSLTFIIYPIKAVEMVISWLIHKITQM